MKSRRISKKFVMELFGAIEAVFRSYGYKVLVNIELMRIDFIATHAPANTCNMTIAPNGNELVVDLGLVEGDFGSPAVYHATDEMDTAIQYNYPYRVWRDNYRDGALRIRLANIFPSMEFDAGTTLVEEAETLYKTINLALKLASKD